MARRETVSANPGIAQLANSYIKSLQEIGSGGPRSKFASAMAEAAAAPAVDLGEFQPASDGKDWPGFGKYLLDLATRPLAASAGFADATVNNIKQLAGAADQAENPFDAAARGFMGDEKKTFADVIDTALPEDFGKSGPDLGEAADQAGVGGVLNAIRQFSPASGVGDIIIKTSGLTSDESRARDLVKGTGGLVGDIALDPINLVAGGVASAVSKGAKFVKGSSKAAEIADSVTGVAPVESYLRYSPEPAKIGPADTNLPNGTGLNPDVVEPSIADKIAQSADTPLSPSVIPGNQARKAAEPVFIDNFSMGTPLENFTSKAAKSFDAAERAKPRIPTYIKEVNPEEYAQVVDFVRGGDIVKPKDIVDWFDNVTPKNAQRYLNMMEKDGIVESIQAAAKRQGRQGNAWITRNVLNKGTDPVEFATLRTPPDEATRAAAIYDEVMPAMKAHFDDLANKGIQPRVTSADKRNYTLSTSDILESLPRKTVEELNFGGLGKSNLYPSQWHAGAATAVRMSELGAAPDAAVREVAAAMRSATRGNATRTTAIESSGNLERAAQELVQHSDELAARVALNAKRFATKNTIDSRAIVETKLGEIDKALSEGTVADGINAVAHAGRDISQAARAVGATDDAAVAAVHEIAPEIAKKIPEADAGFAKAAVASQSIRRHEGFTPRADEKIIKRLNAQYVLVMRDVEKAANEAGIAEIVLGQKHQLVMDSFMERLMHPLRNSFEQGYRAMGREQQWRGLVGKAEHENLLFRRQIKEIARKHDKNNIEAAWTALRRKSVPSDPQVFAAYTDLQGVYNHVLGGGLLGRFFRNGAPLESINSTLSDVGVSYRFKNPTRSQDFELVPDQAQGWDIKDPLSDLEKINNAAVLIEARQTVAASFAHEFGTHVPKPGYVKIKVSGKSKLGPHIDKSLYYPRDAAEALYQLDRLASITATVDGTSTLSKLVQLSDSIMRVWKPFMTIARPGFVLRNLHSDVWMGYFNGVKNFSSYSTAQKSLAAAGEFTSKEAGLGGLTKLTDKNYASGAGVAFQYKGKPVTYQGVYKMAHDNGLIQSWHSTEDILETKGLAEKLMDNAYMRGMGKLNEVEGQFVRLAHFIDLLKRGESVEKAAAQVRRFHPDVHGLTPTEHQVMRRIFPFYTWLRQAFPVVATTMVTKPGRVTAVFKAEYNAAIAMGVNPDSIVDPFPDDKLYPSFILNNMTGPIAGDVGLNLGTPAEGVIGDVLQGGRQGDFGSSVTGVGRNIAGMLNPIVKAPIEVASRTSIGTGGNIADMSDYLDSQLPVVNQVANITGHSVVGLGAKQRAVELGEKNQVFNLQMVNFLTGLGLQDYAKPSYKRFAMKEANG